MVTPHRSSSLGPEIPADSKVAISAQQRAGRAHDGDRQRAPGPLAQPHLEVEDRGARPSASSTTAWPGSVERCDATRYGGRARAEAAGRQRSSRRDESVHQHEGAPRRCPDHRTRHRGDLESADLPQRSRGRAIAEDPSRHATRATARSTTSRLRASPRSSTPVPRPTTSCAPPPRSDRPSRPPPQWCSRCPSRQRPRSTRPAPPATSTPTASASMTSARRHRRPHGQIARPRPHLPVLDPLQPRDIPFHAHIDHPHLGAARLREHVDRGAARWRSSRTSAPSLRSDTPTPRARRPRDPPRRRTPPRCRGAAADRPARIPPATQVPPGGPGFQAAWSAHPDAPGWRCDRDRECARGRCSCHWAPAGVLTEVVFNRRTAAPQISAPPPSSGSRHPTGQPAAARQP